MVPASQTDLAAVRAKTRRIGRNQPPKHNIEQNTRDTTGQGSDDKYDPKYRRIDAKILAEPATDTGNFAILVGAIEFFHMTLF